MLNEAAGLPRLLRSLAALEPPPTEVLAVDGGSADASVAIAEAAGLLVVRNDTRGRAAAINRGVQEATAPIICVLHADTLLPDDAVAVMRRVLADPGTSLAGFTPLLSGPDQVRWGTSFHNWINTWYAPLLFRPQLFLRGVRLLFGDHAMFFRRADFLAVGGCDPTLLVRGGGFVHPLHPRDITGNAGGQFKLGLGARQADQVHRAVAGVDRVIARANVGIQHHLR